MTKPQTSNRIVIFLVLAGLALMICIVAQGFRTDFVPDEGITIPDATSASDVPEIPNSPAAPSSIRVQRRKVPGLSMAEIQAAGLSLREAMYYDKRSAGKVQCRLCPSRCVLSDGERGSCRVRINIDGTLRTLVYGRLVAVHDDPIEKKPLYHFLPATRSLSIATAGCNLGCVFCQNWQISQAMPELAQHTIATPGQVVAAARQNACRTIAYTYTEPTIFYEFMLDCARLAHKEGIRNLWITCGYINEKPLRELCKVMDAANVDLKGFSEEFYAEYCKARLAPVLNTLRIVKEEGMWIEITNLLIPGANDDPKMIRDMCQWIVTNLGADVPLHFSRFHPDYRLLDKPPTPPDTLEMAVRIAKEAGLRHVYMGNIVTQTGDDTFCPKCGRLLIERRGVEVLRNDLSDGQCPDCGAVIAGEWNVERR